MKAKTMTACLLLAATVPLRSALADETPFHMVQGAIDAALVVTDAPASRAWYQALLHVPPVSATPSKTSDGGLMYRYKHGGALIKLVEHSPIPPNYEGEPNSAVGFRWLRIPMVEPPDAPDTLAALGGRDHVAGPDSNSEWALIDPDGNRVYVSSGNDPGYDLEVGLVVSSLDSASRFYGQTLGLKDGGIVGTEHLFWAGRSRLVLRQAPSSGAARRTGVRKEVAGIRFVTFPIEDVLTLATTLAERGVKPVWGPAPPRPDSLATLLFVEDPDGNWVEFYSMRKPPQ